MQTWVFGNWRTAGTDIRSKCCPHLYQKEHPESEGLVKVSDDDEESCLSAVRKLMTDAMNDEVSIDAALQSNVIVCLHMKRWTR